MARPQLEDGHTRIANEIMEQLMRAHLPSNYWQVLLCIIRRTYGYQKKVDKIANFQICEATGLGKSVVSRILRNLEGMHLITRNAKTLGFQKNYEKWQELAEQSTFHLASKVDSIANQKSEKVSSTANQSWQSSQPQLAEQSTKVSSATPENVGIKKKENIKKYIKKVYGEFQNVLLTDQEHQNLIRRFGQQGAEERIENLSRGIASKGYKYKSHYATILNWERLEESRKGGQSGAHKSIPGNRPAGAFSDLEN